MILYARTRDDRVGVLVLGDRRPVQVVHLRYPTSLAASRSQFRLAAYCVLYITHCVQNNILVISE